MISLKRLSSVVNLGLRSCTLVFRFLLSFYVIKYLGYEATGIYGLAVGAVGIVPAMIGWGLNNLVAREIVGVSPGMSASRIVTRLLVTFASLAALTIVGLAAALISGYHISTMYVLIAILVWFETFALDVHLPLIGLEKAMEANVLVFIRSALWVPFAIGLGIIFPTLRNLDAVFLIWIASHCVAIGVLLYLSRRLPLRQIVREPIRVAWLKDKFRKGRMIYLSDLGIVGLIYADRYVVSFMLGLTLTGVYSFYWSLANALQTLVGTAVVQVALPVFVRAYRSGSRSGWYATMRREVIKTAVLTPLLGAGIFIGAEVIINFMSMNELKENRLLFILMLAAAVVRSCSDLLNVGLISTGADKLYVNINIGGLFLSLMCTAIGSLAFGLQGVGIASLITAMLLLAMRVFYLVRWSRQNALLA
jgi:O-antigen/teichoic acid export membrane protein